MILSSLFLLFIVGDQSLEANEDAKRLYESIIKRNEYIMLRPSSYPEADINNNNCNDTDSSSNCNYNNNCNDNNCIDYIYYNNINGRNVIANGSTPLTVKLGLRLSQLVDVDEKNQIITTNVWLIQEWMNSNLKWDPADYSGLNKLHVPPRDLWIPDIVLYNNADGNYEVTLMTMVSIHSDGRVRWEPPVVYKSSCPIDVEFYPFDEQRCSFKFGSWTYDGFQVDLKHLYDNNINNFFEHDIPTSDANDSDIYDNDTEIVDTDSGSIDLRDFTESVEWDLLKVPGRRNQKYYTCCVEPFTDITFSIFIRRKTLFHTVNLIIPCVSITCLTVLVFYLPSDSGEKISLCISILLSLTVFFLLLAEIIPPTSLVIPLIGKFLLFTMILVTLSIVTTVIVLNVHFRSASAHTMPVWVRILFLRVLPRLLGLQDKKFCEVATWNESLEEELSSDASELEPSNKNVYNIMDDVTGRNVNYVPDDREFNVDSDSNVMTSQAAAAVGRFHKNSWQEMEYKRLQSQHEQVVAKLNQLQQQYRRKRQQQQQQQQQHAPQLFSIHSKENTTTTEAATATTLSSYPLLINVTRSYLGGGSLASSGAGGISSNWGYSKKNSFRRKQLQQTSLTTATMTSPSARLSRLQRQTRQQQFHHQSVKIQKCPGSPMFRIEKISNTKEPTANVHTASNVNNDNDDVTAVSNAAAATAAPQQTSDQTTRKNNLSGQRPMRQFMKSSEFVARHMVDEDEGANIREDWKLVARVLDRLFLFIFSCTCVVGTIGIIMKAPTIYDDRLPIATTSGRR